MMMVLVGIARGIGSPKARSSAGRNMERWRQVSTGPSLRALAIAGALGIGGLALTERHAVAPLVPPALWRVPGFAGVNAVTLLVYAAIGVVFLLLVRHLQTVVGCSPLRAGTALLPITVVMVTFSARLWRLPARCSCCGSGRGRATWRTCSPPCWSSGPVAYPSPSYR